MPDKMNSLVCSSREYLIVLSSSISLARDMLSLSSSPFAFGCNENEINGGASFTSSYFIGFFSSHRVPPVPAALSFATTAISPADANPADFCFLPTSQKICPILSFSSFAVFNTVMSGWISPEYTLKRVSLPAKGSVMVLKIYALKGSLADIFLVILFPFLGSIPSTSALYVGGGMYFTTLSRRGWIPTFQVAAPQSTGVIFLAHTPSFRHFSTSSSVISCPSR